MKSDDRFDQDYNSELFRDHFAKVNSWFLRVSDKLGIEQNEWHCLMDCLNGVCFCLGHYQFPLVPAIEGELEDTARLEPDRFNRWKADLNTLLNKVRSLNELQALALIYRVQWMFLVPTEEQFTI
jgi:hypothetical protein